MGLLLDNKIKSETIRVMLVVPSSFLELESLHFKKILVPFVAYLARVSACLSNAKTVNQFVVSFFSPVWVVYLFVQAIERRRLVLLPVLSSGTLPMFPIKFASLSEYIVLTIF